MTTLRDTAEYALGHTGEERVAGLLRRSGWFVIPSYNYSGEEGNKAPRLQGALRAYVIPDLDCARDGVRNWVEVKTKTAATLTYDPMEIRPYSFQEAREMGLPGRLEHGISERHANSYAEVQRITGDQVLLVIYERSTGDVLWATLEAWLDGRRSIMRKGSHSEGAMLYLARDAMRLLGHLS